MAAPPRAAKLRRMTTTPRLPLAHLLVALGLLYLAEGARALSAARAGSPGTGPAGGGEATPPLPIIAAHLPGAAAAPRGRARPAVIGAVVLLAACTLSLAAV